MKLERRTLVLAAVLTTGVFSAGCGDVSMADAKKNLTNQCDDKNAKSLCVCIADELEKAGESAKSIDGLANGDGKDPKVNKAATACATKTK